MILGTSLICFRRNRWCIRTYFEQVCSCMFSGTVESGLFLEGISALSALIGFSGHAKPHIGPLPTQPSHDPMSALRGRQPLPYWGLSRVGLQLPTALPDHGHHEARLNCGPTSLPGLSPSGVPRAGAAPSAPLVAPGWGSAMAQAGEVLLGCPWGVPGLWYALGEGATHPTPHRARGMAYPLLADPQGSLGSMTEDCHNSALAVCGGSSINK